MSVKIMGLVWDYNIPRDEKFVLLAYADHADHDGGNIFPSVATISKKTGYSERSVQSITRKLQKMNLLIHDGKGSHGTNKWKIPLCWGAEIAPEKIAGVQNEASTSGAKKRIAGVQQSAPKPSDNQKEEPSFKEGAKATSIKHAADFPGVMLFREVTERYPAKDTFEIVDNAVKKITLRLGRDAVKDDILPFWQHWRSKGWKPTNLTWLTDWAVSGVIPQNGKQQQTVNQVPKGLNSGLEWLRMKQLQEANHG